MYTRKSVLETKTKEIFGTFVYKRTSTHTLRNGCMFVQLSSELGLPAFTVHSSDNIYRRRSFDDYNIISTTFDTMRPMEEKKKSRFVRFLMVYLLDKYRINTPIGK